MTARLDRADLEAALEVAVGAAKAAGHQLQSFVGSRLDVVAKGEVDFVSQADLAAEATIVKAIGEAFPGDGILGEEGGEVVSVGNRRWIIDPLDGTTNFVHGLPHYCVSIALEVAGRVVVGVVFDPSRSELFEASLGGGARLNGAPISVSTVNDVSQALLATGFPYDRRDHPDEYLAFLRPFLLNSHGLRRAGSAALDLAWVAAGRLDGFWEFKLNPWDVAAGWLLVEEAGGLVSAGADQDFGFERKLIIAAGRTLHDRLAVEVRAVVDELGWASTV